MAPDGTVTPLGLETEETVHATDPTQPYVAYAQEVDGEVFVHVRDVTTDEEVADVVVPGAAGGFNPVSLDGDTVYLGAGDAVYAVDWRTGGSSRSDVLTSAAVAGGHAVDDGGVGPQVVDATTGAVLLSAPTGTGYFDLSPDGRFAELAVEDPRVARQDPKVAVYDVAAGTSVLLPGHAYDYGWSADGDLVSVSDDGTVSVCDAATGACTASEPDLAVLPHSATPAPGVETLCDGTSTGCDASAPAEDFSDDLKLGGVIYES